MKGSIMEREKLRDIVHMPMNSPKCPQWPQPSQAKGRHSIKLSHRQNRRPNICAIIFYLLKHMLQKARSQVEENFSLGSVIQDVPIENACTSVLILRKVCHYKLCTKISQTNRYNVVVYKH